MAGLGLVNVTHPVLCICVFVVSSQPRRYQGTNPSPSPSLSNEPAGVSAETRRDKKNGCFMNSVKYRWCFQQKQSKNHKE